MVNNGELIEYEQGGEVLPPLADGSLVSIAEQVEKRFDAMNKIKKVALKITNANDWVDQNGKPYLQASGAEKVARLFGISWRISEPIMETLEGGHYNYTYKGEFSIGGTMIEAIGTRSSKDGFFKQYRYEGPDGNKKRIELPASEIDRGDVKKSAYTNLLANGITRILGLRNLTYEDLAEFAGINKSQIASVEYKKQSKSIAKSSEMPNLGATDAQVKAIVSMLDKLNIKDDYAKHEKVGKMLEMAEVPASFNKLSKTQASKVIETLQGELKQGEMEL